MSDETNDANESEVLDEDSLVGSIQPIAIQEEMEQSFLDYAMSVIVSRALPDARDGLKPVHRRILYCWSIRSCTEIIHTPKNSSVYRF